MSTSHRCIATRSPRSRATPARWIVPLETISTIVASSAATVSSCVPGGGQTVRLDRRVKYGGEEAAEEHQLRREPDHGADREQGRPSGRGFERDTVRHAAMMAHHYPPRGEPAPRTWRHRDRRGRCSSATGRSTRSSSLTVAAGVALRDRRATALRTGPALAAGAVGRVRRRPGARARRHRSRGSRSTTGRCSASTSSSTCCSGWSRRSSSCSARRSRWRSKPLVVRRNTACSACLRSGRCWCSRTR